MGIEPDDRFSPNGPYAADVDYTTDKAAARRVALDELAASPHLMAARMAIKALQAEYRQHACDWLNTYTEKTWCVADVEADEGLSEALDDLESMAGLTLGERISRSAK